MPKQHSDRLAALAFLLALCVMLFAPAARAQSTPARSDDASIVILLFSSFTCPHCAAAHKMLGGLQAKYPGQVRVVFKHFPLGADGAAYLPHEAALAAADQGKFWPMHDLLFANQSGAGDRKKIDDMARQLKLDLPRFNAALDQRSNLARLKDDVAEANALKVSATPTFYIQGFKLEGLHQASVFEQIIEHRLGTPAASAKKP